MLTPVKLLKERKGDAEWMELDPLHIDISWLNGEV